MRIPFDPVWGLIVVRTLVRGPMGELTLRLALDTGATRTTIGHAPLVAIGCDPMAVIDRIEVTMGGSVEYSPLVTVEDIEALGLTRDAFPVLAHTLPPSASVDGVLGLDFLRGRRLVVDFRTGQIDLD